MKIVHLETERKTLSQHRRDSERVRREAEILSHLIAISPENYLLRGQRMAIYANDYIGILINLFGFFERSELNTLIRFLQPLEIELKSGLALDIGANIGNHTVYFSKFFKSVYAFEPHPETFQLLKFNLQCIPSATAINCGLGDQKGEFYVHENVTNLGGSRISSVRSEVGSCHSCSVARLDDLSIDLDDLIFIKIDVEGFEADVILGASKTIASYQPVIVFEQWANQFTIPENETPSIRLLRDHGYAFCWENNNEDLQAPIGVVNYLIRKINSSWPVRRLKNIGQLINGKYSFKRLVTDTAVPKGDYSMLIAVPKRFHALLGI